MNQLAFKEKVERMRAQGMTYREIAKKLGRPLSCVFRRTQSDSQKMIMMTLDKLGPHQYTKVTILGKRFFIQREV